MAVELTRVSRLYVEIDVAATLPGGGSATITGVDVALLPVGSGPDASTSWSAATYATGTATVLLAGPDAGGSGAIVVPSDADLWAKVTDSPEIDAAKVTRVSVKGGTVAVMPVATVTDAYVAGLVSGVTGTRDALDARYVIGRRRLRILAAKLSAMIPPSTGTDIAIPGYTLTQVALPKAVDARGLYLGTNTIQIPPGAGGDYIATWNLRINGGDPGERNSQIRVNGTGVSEIGYIGTSGRPNGTATMQLAAGDVVDLAVYFAPTANLQAFADRDTNLALTRLAPVPVAPILVGNSGPAITGAPRQIIGEWMAGNTTWAALTGLSGFTAPDMVAFVAANPDGAVDIGIPLIPHEQPSANWDGLLDEVTAGSHDAAYTTLGQHLAQYGPKTVYARLWWEFNLVYNTTGKPTPAKFKAAWARAAPIIRAGFASAARAGQTLSLVYCASEARQPDMDTFWPGDAHVDVVSPDIYAAIWGTTTPTTAALVAAMRDQLALAATFAARHQKAVAVSEWANVQQQPGPTTSQGRGDEPAFIDLMFDWADQVQALYLVYYNIDSNIGQDISDTPLSLARYQARAPLAVTGLET